ncbi:serine hydrolase domain-containing protein [Steroidobacter sp.]|uniref:serine hydrolase domain-containing protein n=1 Tax=Steroidobacter sp. TaxID=1978227 RepID=UPI001A4D3F66|nr:serine hydrolase domain-containing protein [Steroidobacter sp.]MBL8267275.1 beta-lactamase family protein [Steroidobacter sp.]
MMRLILVLAVVVFGQAAASGKRPSDVEVTSLLSTYSQANAPGFAVGIYQAGRPVFAAGFGMADLDLRVPVTADTVFNLASVSKQFTAFAVALLADEGKLDLQADLRTYLPWMPDFGTPVTVANLVHHTSGMPDYLSLAMLAGYDDESLLRQQQILNLLRTQKELSFVPGTEYEYSNSDYVLLAEIVRAVSGMPPQEFLRRRVFEPLGMVHTRVRDNLNDLQPDYAVGYQAGPTAGTWRRAVYNRAAIGPGNVLSTVGDLLKWAGNLAHPTVGDARLIARLTEPVQLNDGTRIGYGFALKRSQVAGHAVIVHDGGISGFQGMFSYFPDDDFAVVILSNGTVDDSAMLERLVALYLPTPSGSVSDAGMSVTPDVATLHALAGNYQSVDGRMLTLASDGEAMITKDVLATKGRLTFHADGSFHIGTRRRSIFQIERAKNGQVSALLERMTGGSDDTPNVTSPYRTRRHERVQLATPSASELARLAGRYRNDAIDATYTVWMDSGRLMLSSLWMTEPQALVPTAANRFDSLAGPLNGLSLTVQPGLKGASGRLVMHYANVRKLEFSQRLSPSR